jgi:predicted nucleotidyltransferase
MGTITKTEEGARAGALSVADALFTKVQQRVLAVLFGNAGRSYYANEVIALAGSGTGAVQRELSRLEATGLVTVTRVGKQKHYQANAHAPVYEELTSGVIDVLRLALQPLANHLAAAFVYGSVAKQSDTATSDVDLMVVSDSLTYADLYAALENATNTLGRAVNPTVYTPQELKKRLRSDNAFVKRVISQSKLWVIGTEHDLPA